MSSSVGSWAGRGARLATGVALLLYGCGPQLAVCAPDQVPQVEPAARDPVTGYHRFTHSHNDYAQPLPLVEALWSNLYSVEADIWFAEGQLEIAHDGLAPRGTLESLYLQPLQARAQSLGSIYGTGAPFTLVIDLKEDTPALLQTLAQTLDRYPMLARYTADGVTPGPVRVVLTGDLGLKSRYVQAYLPRDANRDSNDFALGDPPSDGKWTDYALDWSSVFAWDGTGAMPAAQERRLGCLVENVHRLGRRLRLFNAPDREEAWRVELAHGVDFINTDRPADLSAFLDQQP